MTGKKSEPKDQQSTLIDNPKSILPEEKNTAEIVDVEKQLKELAEEKERLEAEKLAFEKEKKQHESEKADLEKEKSQVAKSADPVDTSNVKIEVFICTESTQVKRGKRIITVFKGNEISLAETDEYNKECFVKKEVK